MTVFTVVKFGRHFESWRLSSRRHTYYSFFFFFIEGFKPHDHILRRSSPVLLLAATFLTQTLTKHDAITLIRVVYFVESNRVSLLNLLLIVNIIRFIRVDYTRWFFCWVYSSFFVDSFVDCGQRAANLEMDINRRSTFNVFPHFNISPHLLAIV